MFVDFFFTEALPKRVFAWTGAFRFAGTLDALNAFAMELIIAPEN
jgi:hypothetical protein